MTENIFERLARKIEQAKARGEREKVEGLKPGFGRNATGGLTYEPPATQLEVPSKAPTTKSENRLEEGAAIAPAPTASAGVWRKTAEHKPPVVGRYTMRRQAMRNGPFDRLWDGAGFVMEYLAGHLVNQENTEWLDTSGEFKVGDRVRVKDGVESVYCKPGMVGTVKSAGRSVWFRADGEEKDFCATGWLEHAPDAPQSN